MFEYKVYIFFPICYCLLRLDRNREKEKWKKKKSFKHGIGLQKMFCFTYTLMVSPKDTIWEQCKNKQKKKRGSTVVHL